MCNSGAHRLTRNSAEGQIFTQEMQLTLSNNQTLKCIRRAYSAVMHFAENATPIAFQRDCIDRVNILTSLCIRHFPFAVVGGRGSTKDFAFSRTPSLHLPRLALELQWACFATKVQNTSPDWHALGLFARAIRLLPCKV